MAKKERTLISENILTTIFEQSPISTQIFSPDGATIKVNKAWEQLWGITLEQINGYNILKDKQLVVKGIMPYIKKGFAGQTTAIPAIKYEPSKTIGNVGAIPFRYVKAIIYPIKNQSDSITEVVLQHEDITDSKLAEEKLADNEKRFRTLIETNTDAIAIVAMDGTFTYVSPTVKKILGYTPHELLGTSTNELFPKDELQRLEKTFAQVVKTPGKTITVEHRTIHKNGSIVWLESTITNRSNTSNINGFVSNFHDITYRKKAEEDQAQLAAIVASSNDAIISKSLEGIITSWNTAAQEMYGYSAKEAVGQHIYLIVPTELRREEDTILAKLKRGEYIDHFETTRVRKDGKRIAVSLTISPIRDINGTIIGASKIARDITETRTGRERQEFLEKLTTALSQSLDEHVTLAEIAKLIVPFLADYCRIVIIDKHNNIQEITVNHKNPKKVELTKELFESYVHDAATVFGVPHILKTGKSEIIAKITDAVFHKYHTDKKTQGIVKAIGLTSYMGVPLLARGKTIGAITFSSTQADRIYTKNDLRFANEIAARVALTLDNVRLYKEATEEIQQRKATERELKKFKFISDNANDALFLVDNEGCIVYANKYACFTLGYTIDELLGSQLSKINTMYTKKDFSTLFHRIHREYVPPFEAVHTRKNGTQFPVEVSVTNITFNDEDYIFSVARDITERKQLEQRKNEFISVASHELKTPVTSIKVYAQVLHKRFLQGGDTKSAEHLAKMDAQLTKLTNLIVDLLDISKIESGKLQFSPDMFWFDDLVQEIVEEMQRITSRHTIQIQGKGHTLLYADRERVGQVMINFISNAVKYSPEAHTIIVHMKMTKTHIELCVEDFGVGIPLGKQDKVFERFYRVSGPKEDTFPGLGLGLYISSEIVKRQGGTIWVESQEQKGSRFCFSLPLNTN